MSNFYLLSIEWYRKNGIKDLDHKSLTYLYLLELKFSFRIESNDMMRFSCKPGKKMKKKIRSIVN